MLPVIAVLVVVLVRLMRRGDSPGAVELGRSRFTPGQRRALPWVVVVLVAALLAWVSPQIFWKAGVVLGVCVLVAAAVGRLMRPDLTTVMANIKIKEFREQFPLGSKTQVVAVEPTPELARCVADAGIGFARPGNRFWPALHRAGFTDRALDHDTLQTHLAGGAGARRGRPGRRRQRKRSPVRLYVSKESLKIAHQQFGNTLNEGSRSV